MENPDQNGVDQIWEMGDGDDTEPEPAHGDHAAWRKYYERRDKALATIVLAVDPNSPIFVRRSARPSRGVAKIV